MVLSKDYWMIMIGCTLANQAGKCEHLNMVCANMLAIYMDLQYHLLCKDDSHTLLGMTSRAIPSFANY